MSVAAADAAAEEDADAAAAAAAAAFFAALAQLRWGLRYLQVGNEEDAGAILVAAVLGGILGAKVYYAALYRDWRLIFDRAGLVWYGGFILGALAVLWVTTRVNPGWAAAARAVASPAAPAGRLFQLMRWPAVGGAGGLNGD